MEKRRVGFGAVELLVIAIVIVVIAFGAWYVLTHKSNSTKSTTPASTSQITTEGSQTNMLSQPRTTLNRFPVLQIQ